MTTYDYLYLLDSEKSKAYFPSYFVQEKNPGHTRPQNFGPKNSKNDHFKANPRLVKIVIVQKSYSLTIFGPLSVRKCQKLGICWFL